MRLSVFAREIIKRLKFKQDMSENELSRIIVDASYRIHKELGPGLFESVYEEILHFEFRKAGLNVVDSRLFP